MTTCAGMVLVRQVSARWQLLLGPRWHSVRHWPLTLVQWWPPSLHHSLTYDNNNITSWQWSSAVATWQYTDTVLTMMCDVSQCCRHLWRVTSQRSSRLLIFSVVITDNLIAAVINGGRRITSRSSAGKLHVDVHQLRWWHVTRCNVLQTHLYFRFCLYPHSCWLLWQRALVLSMPGVRLWHRQCDWTLTFAVKYSFLIGLRESLFFQVWLWRHAAACQWRRIWVRCSSQFWQFVVGFAPDHALFVGGPPSISLVKTQR